MRLILAAARNPDVAIVQTLIAAGTLCAVHYDPLFGMTASSFYPEAVAILLQAGADVTLRTLDGNAALNYAREDKSIGGAYRMLLEAYETQQ